MPGTEKWMKLLKSDKPALKQRAASALLKKEDTPIKALLEILDSFADQEFQQQLIERMSACDSSEVIAAMGPRAQSDDAPIRETVCHILGRLGDGRGTSTLVSLMEDPDVGVRQAAGRAIGDLGKQAEISFGTFGKLCDYEDQPLTEATDYFQPFPDPEDVFAENVAEHARYLLPLATVDLAHFHPAFDQRVHFLLPKEPECGVVGEGADEHFTYLCRANYLGFQYSGDQCRLLADFQYFDLARDPSSQVLLEHYKKVEAGYGNARECFAKHATLQSETSGPLRLADQLGGEPAWGNWAESGDFPLLRANSPLPLTSDGRAYMYVGTICASNYVWDASLDCDLLLFYDPQTQTTLTTFDWS